MTTLTEIEQADDYGPENFRNARTYVLSHVRDLLDNGSDFHRDFIRHIAYHIRFLEIGEPVQIKELDPLISAAAALRESTFSVSDSLIKMKDAIVKQHREVTTEEKEALSEKATRMLEHAKALKKAADAL